MIKEIRQINILYLKWINKIVGWGVFTESKIKKDDVVEVCYCILENDPTHTMLDFVFNPDRNINEVYHCLGFGAIYNHSFEPNIYWIKIPNENIIKFVALRDIEPDEELKHDYGKYYWINKKEKRIL